MMDSLCACYCSIFLRSVKLRLRYDVNRSVDELILVNCDTPDKRFAALCSGLCVE